METEKMENTESQTMVETDAENEKDSDSGERKEQLSVIDFKMVTFSLSGKDYAIDIMNVKEIAKAGRFTYVPNTLPFVLGVYNLRGEIIPILDLRLFFNIEVPDRVDNNLENLLILSVEDQTFGVVVDKIDKVVGVQKSTIQPPHPLFGDINIKYISGVVESNKHLYILLDIGRIFNSKASAEEQSHCAPAPVAAHVSMPAAQIKTAVPQSPKVEKQEVPVQPVLKKNDTAEQDYKFIVESLKTLRHFSVTPLNEAWMKQRFAEWEKQRGEGKSQLQNEADADAYLKPFWSPCSGTWWTKEYADALYSILPDNTAKMIIVWNPGCGKGEETYSLACLLKRRYPAAKIRIYAQDVDLLNVSNAPLLSVPAETASGWYAPFTTKKANGEFTFTQDLKDSIMFEYHDCTNTNALPAVDMIFARDILSLLEQKVQDAVITDFQEKMKGNALLVSGTNEKLASFSGFADRSAGPVSAYNKK